MAVTLALHIGAPKAGSTALQHFLAQRRQQLAQWGICYPNLDGSTEHESILPAYAGKAQAGHRLAQRLPGDAATARRDLNTILARQLEGADYLIISGEHLYHLPPEAIDLFVSDLAALGVRCARVVFYVREPATSFLSSVGQLLARTNAIPDVNTYRPGWLEALPAWHARFPEALTVRAASPAALAGGDVVADFLTEASEAFGVGLRAVQGKRTNVGFSAEAMVVANRFNAWRPEPPHGTAQGANIELVEQLKHAATSRPTTPRAPSEAALRLVYRNAATELAYLRDTFGVAVARPEVPPAAPDETLTDPADVRGLLANFDRELADELAWRVLARGLEQLHSCRYGGGGHPAG